MSKLSPQQLAANRANASHSTGPRTPEGKARSSQNARKHHFDPTAFPVVRVEELDDVSNLLADAMAVYQPVNSQETFAVERIALAQQALLRVERLHSGFFTVCLNQTVAGDGRPLVGLSPHLVNDDSRIVRAQNRNYLLAEGFSRLTADSPTFALLLRYQAQAERLYRRAVEELDRLRKLRHELPNEPVEPTQPEQTEPLTPEQTNPPAAPQPHHPPDHYGPDGELRPPYDRVVPISSAQPRDPNTAPSPPAGPAPNLPAK